MKKQKTMSADGLMLGNGASVLEYQKKGTDELLASLKHQVEFMTKELAAFDEVRSLLNGSHSQKRIDDVVPPTLLFQLELETTLPSC
jgi:hypothetical protein